MHLCHTTPFGREGATLATANEVRDKSRHGSCCGLLKQLCVLS